MKFGELRERWADPLLTWLTILLVTLVALAFSAVAHLMRTSLGLVATAGMLILLINVVGGFIIGVAQHGLSASDAASSYILLAVGDALVAQIPGLLISVAALIVNLWVQYFARLEGV